MDRSLQLVLETKKYLRYINIMILYLLVPKVGDHNIGRVKVGRKKKIKKGEKLSENEDQFSDKKKW